ncbi:MAG: small ligand-binding sensory domain FIST [Candidatus Omnitrophota bacterium]|jgi:small ligand-binding sensory domain FIST
MKWVSSLSSSPDARQALDDVIAQVREVLGDQPPDLVFLFVSPIHESAYDQLQAWIREELSPGHIIGCTARGIIGRGLEVEMGPALCVNAAVLPDTEIFTRHTGFEDMPDADASPDEWRAWIDLDPEVNGMVMLADPFNTELDHFLQGMDYAYPLAHKIGGLASAAGDALQNVLYCDELMRCEGLVLVAFKGRTRLEPIVAQGCRPVGPIGTVTRAQNNMVVELDGASAFGFVQAVQEGLDAYDRKLFKSALFLGITNDPFVDHPVPGDYLVRNLIGIDYDSGAIILAGIAEEGARVQLHLRDRKSSRHDLETLLDHYLETQGTAENVLLFSCLGRGQYLYGSTNHDSDLITNRIGPLPISGFFCAGEIGPVGTSTFIHGYTSSIGVFREGPAV